jgi:hypothetical protein
MQAVEEMFALFTNVNSAGIPDTRVDVNTRVNAVFGRFLYNMLLQINGWGNGSIALPPGFTAGGSGTGVNLRLWDNYDQNTAAADFPLHSISVPQVGYSCAGTRDSLDGSKTLINDASAPNQYGAFQLLNVRASGGPSEAEYARQCQALRTHLNTHYWEDTSSTQNDAQAATAFVLHMAEWPQHNNRVVLISYRRFDGADETGAAYRLGWELALAPGPTGDPKDRVLEFRDYNVSDVERTAQMGDGTDQLTLPVGGSIHIAFRRDLSGADDIVEFFVNGVKIGSAVTLTGHSTPGTDPAMRLVVGGYWDGSNNSNAAFRDIACWQTSLPSNGEILNHFRLTSGAIAKAPPPP